MNVLWEKRKACTEKYFAGRTIVIYGAGRMAAASIKIAEELINSIIVCDKTGQQSPPSNSIQLSTRRY